MTAQVPEILLYEKHRLGMSYDCLPLTDYLTISGLKPNFVASSSMLWRGYMGTWELKNERLYLIGLEGEMRGGDAVSITTLFPGFPERVFAHWYSGTLKAPQGDLLKSGGLFGLDDIYERDFHFELEKGVLMETRIRKNEVGESL